MFPILTKLWEFDLWDRFRLLRKSYIKQVHREYEGQTCTFDIAWGDDVEEVDRECEYFHSSKGGDDSEEKFLIVDKTM